jgi:hypothetical protein
MNELTSTPPAVEAPVNFSRGRFNRAAIKRHFLKISEGSRASKFTRVSEDAINTIEAIAETEIRRLKDATCNTTNGQMIDPDEGNVFLTGEGQARLVAAFNLWLARQMHRHVNNVRTGKTI